MTDSSGFTVEVDQNSYLASGASQVDAIVTVRSTGAARAATGGLEVIIVDCSSSMSGGKIRMARDATNAAIAEVRDGVSFAVIAGTQKAHQVYPPQGGTAVAGAASRADASAIVNRLAASGGTGIGSWLRLAGEIADGYGPGIKHAILLTDGQNGEIPRTFAAALDAVTGKFTCDCRGVGTDWRVDELRTIASRLLGSVEIVADPANLAADFSAIMGEAMGKSVADVALRLWTPRDASVKIVKQVEPTVEDLTGRRSDADARRGDYPLGSWGSESRSYHVQVAVKPGDVGDEVLAGRVSLIAAGSGDVLAQGLIKATWTDDMALSTQINRGVAHYTGQAELAEAIQEGLTARKEGRVDLATARLGRAVALAAESGHEGTARLLEKVVDVIDAPSGTVRLRTDVSKEDEMTLDTRSVRTVRVRGGE